ncbi:hypothetical protein [Pandoraea sputorum]|nr:hypothetical protein [Pandoraea sputorum]
MKRHHTGKATHSDGGRRMTVMAAVLAAAVFGPHAAMAADAGETSR